MTGRTVINLANLLLEKRFKISRKVLDCETDVLQETKNQKLKKKNFKTQQKQT